MPAWLIKVVRFLPELISAGKALGKEEEKKELPEPTLEDERMDSRVVLYDYAMSHCGLPYRWGGDDPITGFDCSGLCIELLQSVGVLPKDYDSTANGLWSFFDSYRASEPKFGALVFYGTPQRVSHVGFCLNKRQVLEAGGGNSRTVTTVKAAHQNAFIRVRPIDHRKDLVGFVHPIYPWKG